MNQPIGGIILAGGQSKRMGTNKALLRLEPEGLTLIEKIVITLREVTAEVLLVTNQPNDYVKLGLPITSDNYRVRASLVGLEAGLAATKYEYNLVVACDMPYLNSSLLRNLVSQPSNYDALVPISSEKQLETLCAIYARSCLPVIRERLEQGDYKMAGWLTEVKTIFVPISELEEFDPALRSFINLNTPEEFERYKNLS
jgi:molybdopterin-guanine dinucleotide biosynthesis protein A